MHFPDTPGLALSKQKKQNPVLKLLMTFLVHLNTSLHFLLQVFIYLCYYSNIPLNQDAGNEFNPKNKYIKDIVIKKYGIHMYIMRGRTKGSIGKFFMVTL